MTLLLSICVAVIFAVGLYLVLGRELKEIAMGLFLLGHGANLGIIAMSGQPLRMVSEGVLEPKSPPIVQVHEGAALATTATVVDPLPQALILTSIVISFAVMAFLLALLVVTHRRTARLWVDDLARAEQPSAGPALFVDAAEEASHAS